LSISEKPVNIDLIYPLIDPTIKSLLGKKVKQAILPELKTRVRQELIKEVTEQYKEMTQQEIE
jgi:hypothetical protein